MHTTCAGKKVQLPEGAGAVSALMQRVAKEICNLYGKRKPRRRTHKNGRGDGRQKGIVAR